MSSQDHKMKEAEKKSTTNSNDLLWSINGNFFRKLFGCVVRTRSDGVSMGCASLTDFIILTFFQNCLFDLASSGAELCRMFHVNNVKV